MIHTGFIIMVFRKLYTKDDLLNRIQDETKKNLDALSNSVVYGQKIENVSLAIGNNTIVHNLKRPIDGYLIIKQNVASSFYLVSTTDINLIINSSAACIVTLLLL